ncbi:MAG: molybdopterin-dependent oxidoreductase [Planctomycetota bacterium]
MSESLPPNQQLIRSERWPVVGEKTPRRDDSPWIVQVVGSVQSFLRFQLDELRDMPQTTRKIDVHCVTRWSKLQMEFTGVLLSDLIGTETSPRWQEDAKYVSFVARSEQNHSTSLPLREVIELDPLVALKAEGANLESQHGGPVRMVVPAKYFYKSVKWLERIEFLREDRLGFWESDAGYHNTADPWKEQRYLAANLSKQEAFKLIEARDFTNRDLRGLSAADRDLTRLRAANAQLRDADFRGATLCGADFAGANLSNAHFDDADLRGAVFSQADVEGADFSGADLRGADFRGASLFGTSFCKTAIDGITVGAVFDVQTKWNTESFHALVDEQRDFVSRYGSGGEGLGD